MRAFDGLQPVDPATKSTRLFHISFIGKSCAVAGSFSSPRVDL